MGTGDEGLHLGMRRLRQADLGDRRHGDARLEGAARRLVLGRLPDGHPLQRHLRPASAETTGARFVQDGVAALRQLRRAMVAPDRPPLNGLVERPKFRSAARTIRPRAAWAAAAKARCSSPAPSRCTAIGRAGCGWRRSRTSPPPACTLSSTPIWPPAPPRKPMAGRLTPALPASLTTRTSSDRWPRTLSCPGHIPLRQPQTLGARRLPRPAPQAPAILPRRVRVPLQSPQHPPCRLPLAAPHRRHHQTHHLQHADLTGSNGISLGTTSLEKCKKNDRHESRQALVIPE